MIVRNIGVELRYFVKKWVCTEVTANNRFEFTVFALQQTYACCVVHGGHSAQQEVKVVLPWLRHTQVKLATECS